jgi:hypothetical protein
MTTSTPLLENNVVTWNNIPPVVNHGIQGNKMISKDQLFYRGNFKYDLLYRGNPKPTMKNFH